MLSLLIMGLTKVGFKAHVHILTKPLSCNILESNIGVFATHWTVIVSKTGIEISLSGKRIQLTASIYMLEGW